MKLDTEFIRLPLDFDVERMKEEVLAVPEEDWRPHPQGHPGNSALPLIAVGGDPTNDATKGVMAMTPHLERCEYLQQVLASFNTVFGRTRLMRLDGNAEATLHVDTNYYWAERVRVHVPIVTSPAIEFICENVSLHMPEGQSWIFDAWRRHNVLNKTGDRRIHLVADTVGSARFWDLVARGERPFSQNGAEPAEPQLVPYQPGAQVRLDLEQTNFPAVMSPWEMEHLANSIILQDLDPEESDAEAATRLRASTIAFMRQWRAAWARFGASVAGVEFYRRLLEAYERGLKPAAGKVRLHNGSDATDIAMQMLVRPALNPELLPRGGGQVGAAGQPRPAGQGGPGPQARQAMAAAQAGAGRRRQQSRFERPIFIVAPPRSGTSLLFETLAQSPDVWTIGGESHRVFESIPALHPGNRGWDSNRLSPQDTRLGRVLERLEAGFFAELRDRHEQPPAPDATGLRLLEKTPKNALRVPFLNAAYPDALFIYLYRDPRESLSSMIAAWESGRFVTYPNLPEWEGKPWSLVLTPEWRSLKGKELPEIVAKQWTMASEILLSDLDKLPAERWAVVGYHNLIAEPQKEIARLCEFAGIEWDKELSKDLPLSSHTLTPPRPDKWKQHAAELENVLPATAGVAARGKDLLSRPITLRSRARDEGQEDSPYRSTTSNTLPQILRSLGSTLLVSTYQTGKLVAVRELDGKVNTHFRALESPMGISHQDGRLAVGTKSQVWEYQNLPQLTAQLQPPGRYDACYVPRLVSYTGDLRVHDVAWAEDELWICATRFSCLATLDGEHSFVPRWRPPFISDLRADDRCHLNGMAVVDDKIRYVTALGDSDEPGGWREKKADGGVLIDVESGETVIGGLSMPHSPRWHQDELWLLESGQGTLAKADLESGKVETVAELPGFTRGLAFAGKFAFVGLSEVREATTFGGLPLTGRLEERECGVWIVDIESGEVAGFLRFEDLVQEIFDVALLPGVKFPEIAEHGSEAVNSSFLVPELVA